MSDEASPEVVELVTANAARVQQLNSRGVQVQGLEAHYLIVLLETLAGPQLVEIAKLAHEQWVSTQLDDVDKGLRYSELLRPT